MAFLVLGGDKGILNKLERRLSADGFSFGYDGDFSDIQAIVMDPSVFANDVEKRRYLKKYSNMLLKNNKEVPIFIYSDCSVENMDIAGFKKNIHYIEYFRESDNNSIAFLANALKPFLSSGNSYKLPSSDDASRPGGA